jgi:hypothetical protein
MRRASDPRRLGTGNRIAAFAGVGLVWLLISAACSTAPVGVDACKRIEQVRCESAQACGISLATPVHNGDSPEENVAACIRYYDDVCLHGIAAPTEPATQAVDACVSAIINGSCDVVRTPESSPACAFLIPPQPAVVDAAADATDATTAAIVDAAGQ